jgi:hypothetical protein
MDIAAVLRHSALREVVVPQGPSTPRLSLRPEPRSRGQGASIRMVLTDATVT